MTVIAASLPDVALLQRYADEWQQHDVMPFTDSFVVTCKGVIDLPSYIDAFYTTWVFKLERWILSVALKRQSSDQQVREMADGMREDFSAWRVEERSDQQIMLCDLQAKTRSWLMVEPIEGNGGKSEMTRLWFGSAVLPTLNAKTGRVELGKTFTLLLGFHKRYSRVLLRAGAAKLRRRHF